MKKGLASVLRGFSGKAADLRVRIFIILAAAGFFVSFLVGIINLLAGISAEVVFVDFAGALLSAGLLYYSFRTHNYRICYFITVVIIFLVLFPFLFFRMGGYHGGITSFMVFAVVFTVFLLEGGLALLTTALELAVYSALLIYAYFNPGAVTAFASERGCLVSNLSDLLLVSVALGATMHVQLGLYRAQQQRVDEQNAVLAQINHSKTQFLANASHEMRTPLTVISVNVQTVMGILKRIDVKSDDEEVQELLQDAQSEIMRLSRMVAGMLSLSSVSESAEKTETDLTALIFNTAEMLRLLLKRNGNELEVGAADGLTVYGNADLLSQVIINLLQNSNAHTKNGKIQIYTGSSGDEITISVKDNGTGISAELLPHIFERGVTDSGTGVGLFLCKTVIESHGGVIGARSRAGAGTEITFTLPVYQGQYGGNKQ